MMQVDGSGDHSARAIGKSFLVTQDLRINPGAVGIMRQMSGSGSYGMRNDMADDENAVRESRVTVACIRRRTLNWFFHVGVATLLLATGGMLARAQAQAQVEVSGAWVRPSVPAQKTSGAYMTITSRNAARLVGASSPVAGATELHETRVENNIARMRPAGSLPLAAGRSVELKPGGYHLMLLDLKRQLKAGESVPLVLRVEYPDGRSGEVTVTARVAVADPGTHAGAGHAGHGH
jgi:copper(I)-binding protein